MIKPIPHSEREKQIYKYAMEDAINEYNRLLKSYYNLPIDVNIIDCYAKELKEKIC